MDKQHFITKWLYKGYPIILILLFLIVAVANRNPVHKILIKDAQAALLVDSNMVIKATLNPGCDFTVVGALPVPAGGLLVAPGDTLQIFAGDDIYNFQCLGSFAFGIRIRNDVDSFTLNGTYGTGPKQHLNCITGNKSSPSTMGFEVQAATNIVLENLCFDNWSTAGFLTNSTHAAPGSSLQRSRFEVNTSGLMLLGATTFWDISFNIFDTWSFNALTLFTNADDNTISFNNFLGGGSVAISNQGINNEFIGNMVKDPFGIVNAPLMHSGSAGLSRAERNIFCASTGAWGGDYFDWTVGKTNTGVDNACGSASGIEDDEALLLGFLNKCDCGCPPHPFTGPVVAIDGVTFATVEDCVDRHKGPPIIPDPDSDGLVGLDDTCPLVPSARFDDTEMDANSNGFASQCDLKEANDMIVHLTDDSYAAQTLWMRSKAKKKSTIFGDTAQIKLGQNVGPNGVLHECGIGVVDPGNPLRCNDDDVITWTLKDVARGPVTTRLSPDDRQVTWSSVSIDPWWGDIRVHAKQNTHSFLMGLEEMNLAATTGDQIYTWRLELPVAAGYYLDLSKKDINGYGRAVIRDALDNAIWRISNPVVAFPGQIKTVAENAELFWFTREIQELTEGFGLKSTVGFNEPSTVVGNGYHENLMKDFINPPYKYPRMAGVENAKQVWTQISPEIWEMEIIIERVLLADYLSSANPPARSAAFVEVSPVVAKDLSDPYDLAAGDTINFVGNALLNTLWSARTLDDIKFNLYNHHPGPASPTFDGLVTDWQFGPFGMETMERYNATVVDASLSMVGVQHLQILNDWDVDCPDSQGCMGVSVVPGRIVTSLDDCAAVATDCVVDRRARSSIDGPTATYRARGVMIGMAAIDADVYFKKVKVENRYYQNLLGNKFLPHMMLAYGAFSGDEGPSYTIDLSTATGECVTSVPATCSSGVASGIALPNFLRTPKSPALSRTFIEQLVGIGIHSVASPHRDLTKLAGYWSVALMRGKSAVTGNVNSQYNIGGIIADYSPEVNDCVDTEPTLLSKGEGYMIGISSYAYGNIDPVTAAPLLKSRERPKYCYRNVLLAENTTHARLRGDSDTGVSEATFGLAEELHVDIATVTANDITPLEAADLGVSCFDVAGVCQIHQGLMNAKKIGKGESKHGWARSLGINYRTSYKEKKVNHWKPVTRLPSSGGNSSVLGTFIGSDEGQGIASNNLRSALKHAAGYTSNFMLSWGPDGYKEDGLIFVALEKVNISTPGGSRVPYYLDNGMAPEIVLDVVKELKLDRVFYTANGSADLGDAAIYALAREKGINLAAQQMAERVRKIRSITINYDAGHSDSIPPDGLSELLKAGLPFIPSAAPGSFAFKDELVKAVLEATSQDGNINLGLKKVGDKFMDDALLFFNAEQFRRAFITTEGTVS